MSFLQHYDQHYAPHLGIRAQSMRSAFEHLIAQTHQSHFRIVETGCARKENAYSDGLSTLIFDDFVNQHDGEVLSVDISEMSCDFARSRVGPKTKVTCQDSVAFLNDLRQNNPVPIDFLYLDSFDLDITQPHLSSLHHLKELCVAMPMLRAGSLVVVDDNPKLMAVIENLDQPNTFQVTTHLGYGGKGKYVAEVMQTIGARMIIDGYQTGWVLR